MKAKLTPDQAREFTRRIGGRFSGLKITVKIELPTWRRSEQIEHAEGAALTFQLLADYFGSLVPRSSCQEYMDKQDNV